jgi:hypothetical protein
MASPVFGICRLCGNYDKLTFEHIPPKKAFNNKQILLRTLKELTDEKSKYRQPFNKGLGRYSLCERCNNLTGKWYGGAFVDFVEQGLAYYESVKTSKVLTLPYYIRPLNVLKQILMMMLAMQPQNAPTFHKELKRYLLNRQSLQLPYEYKVYLYYFAAGQLRFESGTSILDIYKPASSMVLAEVTIPPFGYFVTSVDKTRKSLAEENGLFDITWFNQFQYNVWTRLHLKIPSKETHFPTPLDYRTFEDMEKESKQELETK